MSSSSQDLTGKTTQPAKQCPTTTEEFLIAHGYLYVKKPLLQGLNEEIKNLEQRNGGNADLFIRLRNGLPQWIDSTTRRILSFGKDKKHN